MEGKVAMHVYNPTVNLCCVRLGRPAHSMQVVGLRKRQKLVVEDG